MEQHILNWIKSVSQIRPELNNFAICPFASKSNYKIIESPISELELNSNYDVLIFVVEHNLTLDEIQWWVDRYNKNHKEWKFFEDCGSYNTFINGIQTNNRKYNLVLAQPKEKLRKFREMLARGSYYDLWDKGYLEEILGDDIDIIQP
jgi:hypothetical protein